MFMQTPIVFLHGFPLSGKSWQPQLEFFGAGGANVGAAGGFVGAGHAFVGAGQAFVGAGQAFAPDLRGHGSGPTGPGPWFLHHYVEDLVAWLDHKGLERVVLCGLSMGGYIALQFALEHPERLAALVLADTRADADSNEAKDKRFASVKQILQGGMAGFAPGFAKNALGATTQREQPALVDRVEAMMMANRPEHAALVLGALAARKDASADLGRIRCATLVLVGEEDKVTPVEAAEALAKGISGAKLRVIPRAGHFANLEQPAAFNEALAAFLGRA